MEEERNTYIEALINKVVGIQEPASDTKCSPALRQFLYSTLNDALKQTEWWKVLGAGQDLTMLEKTKAQIIKNELSNDRIRGFAGMEQCLVKRPTRHLHNEALKSCLPRLCQDLDLQRSSLLDDLFASDVVSVSDHESIRGKESRRQQSEEMISCLIGRLSEEQFYQLFLPALSRDHSHLTQMLLEEMDRLEDLHEDNLCLPCRVKNTVQVKRLATPLLVQGSIDIALHADLRTASLSNKAKWAELKTVPDTAIIEGLKSKHPDFYKQFQENGVTSLACGCSHSNGVVNEMIQELASPCTDKTDSTIRNDLDMCMSFEDEDLELVYKMSARPRGICLIIANVDIKGQHERTWVTGDAKKLEHIFHRLEFKVVSKTNLSSSEIKTTLQEHSHINHDKFDAFVCCILTHGDNDELSGSDGHYFKMTSLTSQFTASACPSLAGKPKLFFSIANRGQKHMIGHRVSPTDGHVYSRYVADEADFLIAHSTSAGYKSFWHQRSGSDYVSALIRTLDTHCDSHDLLTCLTLTNQDVSRRNMLHNNALYKQVPEPVFTLTKKMFLTTDPLWNNASD